jgi:hypothetical protein
MIPARKGACRLSTNGSVTASVRRLTQRHFFLNTVDQCVMRRRCVDHARCKIDVWSTHLKIMSVMAFGVARVSVNDVSYKSVEKKRREILSKV